MKIGKGEQEQLQIEIRGNILEQVHHFKYLGSMITEDGRSEKEVRRRIALAKDAFMGTSNAAHQEPQPDPEETTGEVPRVERFGLWLRSVDTEEG